MQPSEVNPECLVALPPSNHTMTMKPKRHQAILELVGAHPIASQDELKRLLAVKGWQVTQATLSRDLRELGVVRASTDEGARYLLPEMITDESKPSLGSLLQQLFSRIDGVGELIVVHTRPSGAQPIAEAIDSEAWPEIIGTLAGENTILIVCRSQAARAALTERLLHL